MKPDRQFTVKIYFINEMPDAIKGVLTCKTKDPEQYSILINNNESELTQAGAFLHEMLHIYRNDLESGKSVDQIELETNQMMNDILRNRINERQSLDNR